MCHCSKGSFISLCPNSAKLTVNVNRYTLLENLTDGANASLYVTNFSLYLTKLYVT